MSKYILFISILFCLKGFAQKEGQIFCEGDEDEPFFMLWQGKKVILWQNTHYVENFKGFKKIKDKTCLEYEQVWENGSTNTLLLRESKGIVYQYETCCEEETIRMPKNPKPGMTWKTADGLASYEIVSVDKELKTNVCNYKGLLELKLILPDVTFHFYYLKGYGYVGATVFNELISEVVPRLK